MMMEPEVEALGEEATVVQESYTMGCAVGDTGVIVEGVAVQRQGPALTNATLRKWVKLWCKGKKKDLPHISAWDTHLVTDMRNLFKEKCDFNDDIGAWDTSSVTTMEGMFSVKNIIWGEKRMIFDQDLGAWDTSKVTDMSNMFTGCESFKGASIGCWDTASVTKMAHMFAGCKKFNGDISEWSVGNVETMSWMFVNAESFNQDISSWSVDKVQDMSWMFCGASLFNQPIGAWRVDNVTMPRTVNGTGHTGPSEFCATSI